jgi:general secretion pathway protein F
MPIFAYRSTTMDGTVSEGVIDAPDKKAAIERIRNTGMIPLEVKALADQGFRRRIGFLSRKVDLVSFTAELSTLLAAGLTLETGLSVLSEISEQKGLKEIVRSLLKSIRGGISFSDALQKHPDVFPRLYINMVRAGEAGGVLDVILEKLNEFLESSKELKDNVMSAMIYPTILMATGGVSIIILRPAQVFRHFCRTRKRPSPFDAAPPWGKCHAEVIRLAFTDSGFCGGDLVQAFHCH